MLPDPLHPAVVHFPLVLAALLPIFALGSLWAIRRGASPRKAWGLSLALAGVLTVSAFVGIRTGEAEEERVEDVVSEEVIHEHEEAAERFLVLSGVLFVVAAGGLAGGALGSAARIVATLGAFGVLAAGVQVGDAGGALVYEHGAADAYVGPSGRSDTSEGRTPSAEREEEEEGGVHEQESVPDEVRSTRMVLPGLYGIMRSLERDVDRVSRGLWLENFDTVAAAARAVADHPKVPSSELARVAEALGPELADFRAHDVTVHDLAVDLEAGATEGNLREVMDRDARLREACVACHTAFRDRLRAALR